MGILEQMPILEADQNKLAKESEFKFQHNFKDGTVGRYKTKEELEEAKIDENENTDKGY